MKGFRTTARRAIGVLALGVVPLAGCGGNGGGDDQAPTQQGVSPGAQPMGAEVQALVDQGNTAQREGRYEDALGFYRQAMDLAGDHPVPQFGALMAATALGDSALADSLRSRLEVTGPDLLAMMGPGSAMGGGSPHGSAGASTMPPGHPDISGSGGQSGALPPDTGAVH